VARSVLIVSNGRGENAVGAAIARALGDHRVAAYPLVGMGEAYAGVELLDPRLPLPSGGFALRGGDLLGDLRAGATKLFRTQRRTLRGQAGQRDAVVAVGDVFCLWMAAHTRVRPIFVATAKSEHNEPHRALELWQIRRRASVVFTRDQRTADALAKYGIRARYDGNPLVDAIPEPKGVLPLTPGAPVLLLLPGSRADALRNLLQLLKVSVHVASEIGAHLVCAIPPTLQVVDVVRQVQEVGWQAAGEFIERGETRVLLTRDFGAALRAATVAVGLAGTANEQVAAFGKPVVAFAPAGAVQFTTGFLTLQKRLLGEGLVDTLDWEDAAKGAVWLLLHPDEAQRRGEAGRQRMGEGGAVDAIAATLRG